MRKTEIYQDFQIQSSNFYNCYNLRGCAIIDLFCENCHQIKNHNGREQIKICKTCASSGICSSCYGCTISPTFTFLCSFCDLGKTPIILRSLLCNIDISGDYKIPVLIIPDDMDIVNLNFFLDFYNDAAREIHNLDTFAFGLTQQEKKLIQIEKDNLLLAKRLNKMSTTNCFNGLKLYYTFMSLAMSNFRHLVIVFDDDFKVPLDFESTEDIYQKWLFDILGFVKYTPYESGILFYNGQRKDIHGGLMKFCNAKRGLFYFILFYFIFFL